jgi:methyl-accepting chemotaxis protein
MSLGQLFKATKSISFKLTAWYSGVFILSAILLFHLSFFFLSNTLERQDRSRIVVELEELAAKYETGGMPSLENELLTRQTFRKKRPFIVRVADGSNASVSTFSPAAWTEFDLTHMEELPPRQKVRWAKLPSREGSHFLVMGLYRLSDGLWLQVGLSTEEREALLERFRGNLIIPSLSIVLVGLLVGPLLAFRALRPIRKLIGTMRSMNVAAMGERLPVTGAGDELSELVDLFNEMLAKIETLITAMRAALDNVAHDLRTPLTRLRGTAEMALHADAGLGPATFCLPRLCDMIF